MGIYQVKSGKTRYQIEFERHGEYPNSELPVEKLHAVFLETSGMHPDNARAIAVYLNTGMTRELFGPFRRTYPSLIERAKERGTELWLGDIKCSITGSEPLFSTSLLEKIAANRLAKRGYVGRRKLSQFATRFINRNDPFVENRNYLMALKIKALAQLSRHTQIGVVTGASHAGIVNHLKRKETKIDQNERKRIAKMGWQPFQMFRCIYDKQAGRWQVEEHSL